MSNNLAHCVLVPISVKSVGLCRVTQSSYLRCLSSRARTPQATREWHLHRSATHVVVFRPKALSPAYIESLNQISTRDTGLQREHPKDPYHPTTNHTTKNSSQKLNSCLAAKEIEAHPDKTQSLLKSRSPSLHPIH
jgi:phage/plasmid-associated DNA primase